MTRLICSILAAGSTAFSMAAPASAHSDPKLPGAEWGMVSRPALPERRG